MFVRCLLVDGVPQAESQRQGAASTAADSTCHRESDQTPGLKAQVTELGFGFGRQ